MRMVFPEEKKTFTGCDEWCIPLHLVEKSIAGQMLADAFSVWDFMVMGRVDDEHGSIVLYKHFDTRRYLNVDDAGRTYRYSPGRPQSGRRGDYLPLPTLAVAINHLDLGFRNFEGSGKVSPTDSADVPKVRADPSRRRRKTPRIRG